MTRIWLRNSVKRNLNKIRTKATLKKSLDSVWIKCENLQVCVHRADEGVIVDIWATNKKGVIIGDGPLASTYSFFAEAEQV